MFGESPGYPEGTRWVHEPQRVSGVGVSQPGGSPIVPLITKYANFMDVTRGLPRECQACESLVSLMSRGRQDGPRKCVEGSKWTHRFPRGDKSVPLGTLRVRVVPRGSQPKWAC